MNWFDDILQKMKPDDSPVLASIDPMMSINPDRPSISLDSTDMLPARTPAGIDPAPSGMSAPQANDLKMDQSQVAPLSGATDVTAPSKYNLGNYTSEQRQKLVDQNNEEAAGPDWKSALAALGTGFTGGDPATAAAAIKQAQLKSREQKLNDFDKTRSSLIEDKKYAREQDLLAREQDPNSAESKIAQEAAKKMGYKGDTSKITAEQFKAFSPAMEKIYQVETNKQTRQDAREKKQSDTHDKYVESIEKMASSLRGDDAAKASSAKLSAIASGRALLNQYKGREDEMTPDQLAILAADRVKAVTGGVPGQEEIRHMMPSNVGTSWAGLKSYWSGAPEPAHSGGWVKEAAADFDAQERAAQNILKNRQDQITSNPKLTAEEKARISKMAVPPEYQQSLKNKLYDPDVLEYARSHDISPEQANNIKMQRSGK